MTPAYDYMRNQGPSAAAIALLESQTADAVQRPDRLEAISTGWASTRLKITPDPVRVASEGALWVAFRHTNSCAMP